MGWADNTGPLISCNLYLMGGTECQGQIIGCHSETQEMKIFPASQYLLVQKSTMMLHHLFFSGKFISQPRFENEELQTLS